MPRGRRAGGLVLALLTLLALLLAGSGASAAPPARAPARQTAAVELQAQTPVVASGGTYTADLRLVGVPADGSIRLVLHQRVRTRSELALSRTREGLRSEVFSTVFPVTTLAARPDGIRRLTLSLDPTTGRSLAAEGVYPVELIAQDAGTSELAAVVTHLIVGPEEGDDAPSLGVGALIEVEAPPAFQPDGTVDLDPDDVAAMAALIEGMAASGDVPATVAARPETLEALADSPEEGDAALVEALRDALDGRTVLGLPYADVRPDDLAPPLLGELGPQLDRGRQVLTELLGVRPTDGWGMAPPDLGEPGLAALAYIGSDRLVVADDQVEPLDPPPSYSLAQPFLLAAPEGSATDAGATGVQALATDPTVLDLLHEDAAPGLVASDVLSELAFIRLEQPSLARSAVLPLDPGVPAEVVALVLEGLDAGRPFEALSLDAAFDHAGPLVDGGDNLVDRQLEPVASTPIRDVEAGRILAARADLSTFATLVGPTSPAPAPLERHLLLATSDGLAAHTRRAHVDAVNEGMAAVTGAVSTPPTFTLTLTARDGTIPLTIRNDSGQPLRVSIHLRSQKLEFPDGDTIEQVLTEPTTRIDISVRSRASGAFPLEADVMTPDGRVSLSMTRYTVRSTAVSGAGLVLSVGAGLFLAVWWARHWRRTRRSAKLVAADAHPAVGAT